MDDERQLERDDEKRGERRRRDVTRPAQADGSQAALDLPLQRNLHALSIFISEKNQGSRKRRTIWHMFLKQRKHFLCPERKARRPAYNYGL